MKSNAKIEDQSKLLMNIHIDQLPDDGSQPHISVRL